jgi:hypothetical protein
MTKLKTLLQKLRVRYTKPRAPIHDYDYDDPYLSNLTWSLDLTTKDKNSKLTAVKQKNKGKQ